MPAHKASVPAARVKVCGWWLVVHGLGLVVGGWWFVIVSLKVFDVYRTSAVGVIGGGVEEHVRSTLNKGSKQ